MSLTVIMEKTRRLLDLEAMIADAQSVLAELERERALLSEVQIPELMVEEGLDYLGLDDGRRLSVKPVIRASIPTLAGIAKERDAAKREDMQARRDAALAWIRAHGHEGLLRVTVEAAFGPGEEAAARACADSLAVTASRGVTYDETVHASTLAAFVRERLEAGDALPLEAFSVVQQRRTEIK